MNVRAAEDEEAENRGSVLGDFGVWPGLVDLNQGGYGSIRKEIGPEGVVVKSSGQYPAYRFYERHLRGFDPFDGPMCKESTCASDSAV